MFGLVSGIVASFLHAMLITKFPNDPSDSGLPPTDEYNYVKGYALSATVIASTHFT